LRHTHKGINYYRLSVAPAGRMDSGLSVCLSAHTSREGKHGTQCSFLTEKELQYTRDVIKKARK